MPRSPQADPPPGAPSDDGAVPSDEDVVPLDDDGAALTATAARRRRRLLTAALAVVLAVHVVALYLPGEAVPSPGVALPGLDKAIHVLLFAAPAALLVLLGAGPVGLGLLALHAPVSEVLQARLVPQRSGDPTDLVADLAGLVLGALAAWAARRRGAPG